MTNLKILNRFLNFINFFYAFSHQLLNNDLQSSKLEINGLTGLRFFAALMVLMQHGADNLKSLGVNNLWLNSVFFTVGVEGVYLFFILSGYLLARLYLLGDTKFVIDLFYKKRFWRIFPLYIIGVLSCYLLLSISDRINHDYIAFKSRIMLFPFYLVGFPNFIIGLPDIKLGSLTSLWSIGTELQFYFLFPLIVYYFRKINHKSVLVIGSMILVYMLFYYLRIFPGSHYFKVTISTLRFDLLFIGICSAIILDKVKSKYNFYYSEWINYLLILTAISAIIYGLTNQIIWLKESILIFSFICLIFLLTSNKSKTFFDWPSIHYLGAISYGIYIYHPLVSYPLRAIINALIDTTKFTSTSFVVIYFIILIGITIIISHFSYQYIERRLMYRETKSEKLIPMHREKN
jgi:peptidoglycan/LPS O-acetylase OafA/YrhL